MDATSLLQLSQWAGARLCAGLPEALVEGVCTDSRSLRPGQLFVALRGEHFDGHGFVESAAALGAAGALVEQVAPGLPVQFGVLQVEDTLAALQRMAGAHRASLPMRVVAVTGSNGKTSTKDLAAAVLSERFQVCRTQGNLNNHIGLPLSLLRAGSGDGAGVFEIGMNHPGEIAPLAALAAPDVAIITGIGTAHIEFMGSREAIAKEKGMLAEALRPAGTVILSAEDEFSSGIAGRTGATAVYCGIGCGDFQARDLRQDLGGSRFVIRALGREVEAAVPVSGVHMVRNALMAVAAGSVLGLSLEQCVAGLARLELTKGRLERKGARGIEVLDDTYNANPDSVAAALHTLAALPTVGRRVAVLGRMGELGSHSAQGHSSVGLVAAELGLDLLLGVGEEPALAVEAARAGGMTGALHAATVEEAVSVLRHRVVAGDLVLVKGSRSARMERVVEGLLAP